MSERVLVIEAGVAVTRAALIENDAAARFWFGPARGDEARDAAPMAGRRFAGRVRKLDRALNAAFIDVGDGRDAFLALGKTASPPLSEGALVAVAVKSPPRQTKGAVLKRLKSPVAIDRKTPGRLGPIEDAALEAVKAVGGGAKSIIVDDGEAFRALTAARLDAEIVYEPHCDALFETHGAESALEDAFAQVVPLSGGGRLIIDETQALTAIDVDTGGLSASSPVRLRERIAVAAAYEAVRQVRLRDIGGHVVIDFPSISNKPARARFAEHLQKATASLESAGAFGFAKSGLYSFATPHSAQSLTERFTEAAPSDPVSGRRFTLDWRAKSALRTLEHRLRAAPRARCLLAAGRELAHFLQAQKTWTERLQMRYGARFTIAASKKLEDRSFDLSE